MEYWKAVRKINKNTFQTGGVGGSVTTEFKIGETYQVDGEPILCRNGFHFYRKQDFIFGINLFRAGETEFIEIEPLDEVVSDTEKSVCCKIKVLRYISKRERLRLLKDKTNSGDYNSGNFNSGDRNSGDYNSGYCNSGNRNSGDYNSGNCNSRNCNSGNRNSGNFNSGNRNSGDYNSGDRNSGSYNSGNCNSGNCNSGDRNSGDSNPGYYNSGDYNSGNCNSGNCNSGDRNFGYYNSGDYNSGHWNSGNGYRNYFCTETKYFLFDLEVSLETIKNVQNISMSWFNLENKSYKEAWAQCPSETLEQIGSILEFQTAEARAKFTQITGLTLPEVKNESF